MSTEIFVLKTNKQNCWYYTQWLKHRFSTKAIMFQKCRTYRSIMNMLFQKVENIGIMVHMCTYFIMNLDSYPTHATSSWLVISTTIMYCWVQQETTYPKKKPVEHIAITWRQEERSMYKTHSTTNIHTHWCQHAEDIQCPKSFFLNLFSFYMRTFLNSNRWFS